MKGILLLLGLAAFPRFARADVALPLSSYRSQGGTDHCWAYATSHFLEARGESRLRVSVVLDTERDLRYWVLHDRFLQRYRSKAELDGGLTDSGGIVSEQGYPVEFLMAFLAHGHPTHSVTTVSGAAAYAFPAPIQEALEFIGAPRPDAPALDYDALLASLKTAPDTRTAENLISTALGSTSDRLTTNATAWVDSAPIPVTEVPQRMLPAPDVAALGADELVWLQANSGQKLHQWGAYYGGKYSIYYVNRSEFEMLAKKSLDGGWPILDTDYGHVWAVIGYQGDHFIAADSAEPGMASSDGLRGAVGIFVLRSFLSSEHSDLVLGMPHGLPRDRAFPTHNPDVHVFR